MQTRTRFRLLATTLACFALTTPAQARADKVGVAEVEGTLEISVADDFEHGRSEMHAHVRDDKTGEAVKLKGFDPDHLPPGFTTGARVRARGQLAAGELHVETNAEGHVASGMSVEAPAQGARSAAQTSQTTLVILLNFLDAAVSCPANLQANLFGNNPSVRDYFASMTFGQMDFDGLVVGPYAIAARTTDACDYNGWSTLANRAAKAAHYDTTAYQHVVYVFPRVVSCGWAGLGNTPGRLTWNNGSCGYADVFAHELGHNLGLQHSSTPAGEYADLSDVMGLASNDLRQVNAPHREQMGWIAATQVATVSAPMQVTIAPLELDPTQAAGTKQAIKVATGVPGEFYYFSYRQPLGYDASLTGANLGFFGYANGVSVHRFKGSGFTYLLAGLADGELWGDGRGITVTQSGHDASGVTFFIDRNCGIARPTMSIAPSWAGGPPGAATAFTVTVTNTDNAGCPPSTFAVRTSASAPLTAPADASLKIAGGASGAATLVVVSDRAAGEGRYRFSASAEDAAIGGHAASTTAYCLIDATPPAVPGTPSATVVAVGKTYNVQLAWMYSKDNLGLAGYEVFRDGVSYQKVAGSSFTDTAVAKGISYSYSVRAYDQVGLYSPQSGSTPVAIPRK